MSVLNGVEQSLLREVGIDVDNPDELLTNEKFRRIVLAALDWVHFAESYFKNPRNVDEPLVLEEWQKRVIKFTQYGDKKYLVLICPRGFGKSIVTAIITAIIMIFMPSVKIGLYAMGQNQSTDLLDKTRFFLETSDFNHLLPPRGGGLANNKERIQLLNGSDTRAYPCTEAIRGRHNDVVVIDEMSRIPDRLINETIRPTGRRAFKEIGLSTPAGMTGEFWRSTTKTDINEVFRIGALEVSWMTPEILAAEERRLGPFAAKQELYAEFIPTGDTLINMEWVTKSYEIHGYRRTKWDTGYVQEAGRRMVMGADFGRDRDRSVFTIGHRNQYGVYMIDYMESMMKAPYPVIIARLVHLCKKFNVKILVPDATGLGEPIIDMINVELSKVGHSLRMVSNTKKREGFVFSHSSKLDLLNDMVSVYADGLISVPFHGNDEEHESLGLERELISFQFEIKNTGSAKPSIRFGTQSEHDDRLISVALLINGLLKARFAYHKMKTR